MVEWRCRKRAYKKQSLTKETKASCPCRNVSELQIQAAILKAFNMLPGKRDDLLRMQGAIWDGQIRRLDHRLSELSEERKRLEEQIDELMNDDHTAVNGVADEQELRARLDRLETEYTRLVMERAEAANKDVQVRVLLELISSLSGDDDDEQSVDEKSRACYDYEEFFRRTRYEPDEGVIVGGRIVKFEQKMITRYLESVVVNDEDYEVRFKAGLSVNIPNVGNNVK